MKEPFRADMEMIRRRAREKMDQGAVTSAYKADRDQVIAVLNEVLATEIVCTLRYKNHYYMCRGVHGDTVAEEFLQHAREEEQHADQVARRMMEEILAKEEEHADDLAMLLEPSPRPQAAAQLQALPVGQTRFPTR